MKKRVIIPVSPIGILNKFGYYSRDPAAKRRKCLDRMLKYHAYKAIIARLNATAIRFKNIFPQITRNIRADMKYLKKKRVRR